MKDFNTINNDLKKTIRKIEKELNGLWISLCLIRDNFTCQLCHKTIKETILVIHRIFPKEYKVLKYEPDNGITLCKNCKKKVNHNSDELTKIIEVISKKDRNIIDKLKEKIKEDKELSIEELKQIRYNLITKINDLKKY